MGTLSRDLHDLGYSRTEKESPFDEDGELWTKGYELVCDETGIVISDDGGSSFRGGTRDSNEEEVYRYYNSNKVRMPGGYVSSYAWGEDDTGRFTYARSK